MKWSSALLAACYTDRLYRAAGSCLHASTPTAFGDRFWRIGMAIIVFRRQFMRFTSYVPHVSDVDSSADEL